MLGTIIQQTVNALTIGSIYALIALGYTMVYGVLRMINFAHGEMFMLGAYAAFLALTLVVGDIGAVGAIALTLVFFGAIVAVGFVGVGIERLAYRPLRNSTRLAPMLSSLGVSLSLVTGVQILAGPQPVGFPSFFPTTRFDVFGGTVTLVQIGILIAAFILMFGLYTLVNRSRMGIIVRAVSESRPTAQLLGINVNLAISMVFFSGPLLGAAGGILYASYYGIMSPTMGAVIGLKAFTAAILGGIGSIPGAMLGAYILAFVEVGGTALLPVVSGGVLGTEYRDVLSFAILILVLLIRPAGILGEPVSEESMVYKREF
ncbi:amino acid/amide ABC transporter membrane protein 1 (HAAT family) [Rhizobium subbaraonis]|uniref:Amino acid/amide ABC transporter membrane protein 1 (HAAT family) n=1 Tax=Rhizobium subbaraonis TaxID=908946 RepID=A0A285UX98_9HYPH|nr:branched-chain amino acid ABC transporter permease [Rhizobium subbaraonis]SOC46413.1 amino acid/amide ABC transporter membrane protein 1 (HAAT family) [Rhizobium subbaraonis]